MATSALGDECLSLALFALTAPHAPSYATDYKRTT